MSSNIHASLTAVIVIKNIPIDRLSGWRNPRRLAINLSWGKGSSAQIIWPCQDSWSVVACLLVISSIVDLLLNVNLLSTPVLFLLVVYCSAGNHIFRFSTMTLACFSQSVHSTRTLTGGFSIGTGKCFPSHGCIPKQAAPTIHAPNVVLPIPFPPTKEITFLPLCKCSKT